MKSIIPSAREIAREALIVMGTAVVIALIVNAVPGLKKWMQDKGVVP